jgi:hypothetical protein
VSLKRTMTALALGVLATTTACGGSSSGNQASSSTTTSINPSVDRATATAMNLKASDLPGWTQTPNQTSSADQALTTRLASCAGAPNPSQADVVDVMSPNFDQGQTEVSSDATMVRTHADGLADLNALKSSKLSSCFQQVAVPTLKTQLPSGATLSNFQVNAFSPTGAPPDSFALHVTITVSVPQQGSVAVDVDEIGFLVGRAEVSLTSTDLGAAPSQTLENRLLSLLVARSQQAGTPTT